jgi:hypothetical protein
MNKEIFTLTLTTGELFWLGRIFGKNEFPFLFPGENQPDLQQMAAAIQTGRETLIKKGWVKSNEGKTYQVDRLIYFLVDWLSQPEKVTVVDTISRARDPLHYVIHERQGHFLLVEFQVDGIQITLYKDYLSLSARLVDLFGGEGKSTKTNESRVFPILQPIELIKLSWKSNEMAMDSLLAAGFNKKKAEGYIHWIDQVESAGMISLFEYAKDEQVPRKQGLFIIDPDGDWLGQDLGLDEKVIVMTPVNRQDFVTRFWEE